MTSSAAALSAGAEPRPNAPLSAAPVSATPRTALATRTAAFARSDMA